MADESKRPAETEPEDDRSVYDRARSKELQEHASVLPGLIEARRKFHRELLGILDYLKELQGRLIGHDALAREWEGKASEVLARDPGDVHTLARYAVKKKLHHAKAALDCGVRVREIAAQLSGLLETTVDLDDRIEKVAHLERRVEIAKNVADAKAEVINLFHSVADPTAAGSVLARLEETCSLAEAESAMGDAMLELELPAEDQRFLDAEIDEEMKRLGGGPKRLK